MNTLSDKELKLLFQQNKTEIKDNGFTQRVMNNIPHKRNNTNWIIGAFSIIGIFIFLMSGAGQILLEQVYIFIDYITDFKRPPIESVFVYLLITGGILCTTFIAGTTKR